MGEVYLAHDRQLERRVALKMVKRGFGRANLIRHFRQENASLPA
jgi:serine/threonine protein kinase